MLSTKKGLCLLKIYQPKRNPTPHLPAKSPQNSTHKNIIKIKKWNIHSNKQIKQKLYGNYLLKKLYKLTWNILYIKQKQLCCKDSVKTFFFYFNLSNFTKNLQTTLINQRIFNMECTRIWGSYLVVNASNNAVISTTNIMQSDTSSCMAITNKNHCYTEWGFRFHFVHKQGM